METSGNMDIREIWNLAKTRGQYDPKEYGQLKDKCITAQTHDVNAPTAVNQHIIRRMTTSGIIDTAYTRYNQDGTKTILFRPKQEMGIIQTTNQIKTGTQTIKTNKNGGTHRRTRFRKYNTNKIPCALRDSWTLNKPHFRHTRNISGSPNSQRKIILAPNITRDIKPNKGLILNPNSFSNNHASRKPNNRKETKL